MLSVSGKHSAPLRARSASAPPVQKRYVALGMGLLLSLAPTPRLPLIYGAAPRHPVILGIRAIY